MRDWRLHQIGQMPNVELYLASRMDPETVLETGARHVFLATGSLWRDDGRGRSHPRGVASFADPRTMTPEAILNGARPKGPVVIFDDEEYHIAAGLADMLASEGLKVTYITPAGRVADWTSYTVEQSRLQARLIERGVTILTGTIMTGLSAGAADLACAYTGRRSQIACDGFVPVTSREPQDGLWLSLKAADLASLRRIGDARAPGVIAHAVHDGHRFAREHLEPPDAVEVRRERPIIRQAGFQSDKKL